MAIGLDIGGAHLKLSDETGVGCEIDFPFWKMQHQFAQQLDGISNQLGRDELIGITMTAELADCFDSRQEGVEFIVDCVAERLGHLRPLFYQTDGSLVDTLTAKRNWHLTAASNWHASATFLSHQCSVSDGFFVDIGSTTSDFIPVFQGRPALEKLTDFDRLASGQLVYAGIGRTPICSLVDAFQIGTQRIPVARELFATVNDAFLTLGDVPENAQREGADGRPQTIPFARKRLLRMVCCDQQDLDQDVVKNISKQVRSELITRMAEGLCKVLADHPNLPRRFCIGGSGLFLVKDLVSRCLNEMHPTPMTPADLIWYPGTNPQLLPAHAVAVARKKCRPKL